MNNKIWNPNTNKFVSLFSKSGKATLKQYIKHFFTGNQQNIMHGGSEEPPPLPKPKPEQEEEKELKNKKKNEACDTLKTKYTKDESRMGGSKIAMKCKDKISQQEIKNIVKLLNEKENANIDENITPEKFCEKYIVLSIKNLFLTEEEEEEIKLTKEIREKLEYEGKEFPILLECNNKKYYIDINYGENGTHMYDDENPLNIYHKFLLEVQKLHKANYVHLDLKPENFVVNENKEGETVVRLIDFGSDIKANENKKLKLGAFTSQYAHKEHRTLKEVSFENAKKFDVFSCTMIFYELLNKKNIHKQKPSMLGYTGDVAERDLRNYNAFNFVPDLNDIPTIEEFINNFNEIKKKLSQEEEPLCKKIIENYEDGNSGKYKTAMKCKNQISQQEIIDIVNLLNEDYKADITSEKFCEKYIILSIIDNSNEEEEELEKEIQLTKEIRKVMGYEVGSFPILLECNNKKFYIDINYGVNGDNYFSDIDAPSKLDIDAPSKLDIYLKFLSEVQKLHKNNYVHLDLKPENFVIDEDGKVHLIDFGAAVKKPDDDAKIKVKEYPREYAQKKHINAKKEGGEVSFEQAKNFDVFSCITIFYELFYELLDELLEEKKLKELEAIVVEENPTPTIDKFISFLMNKNEKLLDES